MTTITLPLTEAQAVSIVVAADAFGVEPWEMAVHVLDFKRRFFGCISNPPGDGSEVQHIDGSMSVIDRETDTP